MYTEQIAKLYGTLEWHVNNSGLKQFQRALDRVQNSLKPLQDAVAKAESKLNGVGKAAAQQREKLSGRVRHNLNREHQLETALLNAKRDAWAAELKQSKLVFSGKKETAGIATAAIRDQQLLFTQLAKTQRKQAMSVEASRLKALRLAELLKTQEARTALLEQRRYNMLTGVQKLEHQIQQLRERGQRQAIEFQARQASRAASERRKDVAHQYREIKHGWAMERHQAWQRRQQERQNNNNGMGVFGLAGLGGLGPIAAVGAGIFALQAAVNRLGDRIQQSQDKASNSEQWTNVLEQAGGKNPDNQQVVRDSFIRIAQQYGTSVDLESAKDYRGFIMQQTNRGESLTKAIKLYETQQAAFRGAGMTTQEQQRANLQATQVRTIGKGDTEDLKTFAEAAPLIKPYISQAWAEATKFKGSVAKRESEFYKLLPKGSFKAEYLNRAFELFVKENGDMITKQSKSIQAEQQRTENAKILQEQNIYTDENLNTAVRDRIASERELVAASEELKRSFMGMETWLNKQTAKVYRTGADILTGKFADDAEKNGIKFEPEANLASVLERSIQDKRMLSNPPINLLAPQQEANPAFGELGKALLSFKAGLSPRGEELLSGKQSQAPAAAVQALKQTFNNHSETHVDASVTFGDVVVNVPNFISGPEELANVISDKIRDDFGQHHDEAMQTIYRKAMINAAERRK